MKINPIINYSNQKNINFKAKMSKEVWDGLDFLRFETSQMYGADSQEYNTLEKRMKNILALCPKEKIITYTYNDEYGLAFYTFALKRLLWKPKVIACNELFKDDLYSMENIKLLENALEEEEKKLNKKI